MALKLFRSTGYSSILMAGETRLALHPGWTILGVSLWAGYVCNVALWRALAGSEGAASAGHVLVLGAFLSGACAMFLSLLGWRKTFKPAATLVLIVAALAACSIWSQALPVDATLLDRSPSTVLVPPWASLLRWQVLASLAGLALVPAFWLWQKTLRRLSGPEQLKVNIAGIVLGAAVVAATGWMLSGAA